MLSRAALSFAVTLVLTSCTAETASTPTAESLPVPPVTTGLPSQSSAPTTTPATTSISPADLVILGGPVITMDPQLGVQEAVAIVDDFIEAIGSASYITRYIGPETVVLDLQGRTVIPGFVDAHTHILTDMGGIEAGQQLALSNGITSVADASVEPDWSETFIDAAESGLLTVRTSMYFGRTDACGEDAGRWYETYPANMVFSDRLRVAGVKIFADGGVCGALASSEPFLPGYETGEPFHTFDELISLMRDADNAGYQLLIHAQGDVAITQVQNAYAQILHDDGNPLRHRVDHNVFQTAETIGRYSELELVPVLFGSSEACNGDLEWTDFYKTNAERPGDIVAANPELIIAWHGDDPWVTPISPLSELFSLITRGRVSEDGDICEPPAWMADGGVTVQQGLAMMTTNAAYAIGQDHRVGSLSPGKLADLLLLSDNPLSVDPYAIPNIEILMTMIGGVTEFCQTGSESLCPHWDAPAVPLATASASRADHGPDAAFDQSSAGDSFWSSGGDAPQWIRYDFPEPTQVTAIRFVVFQNPPSDTTHELEIMVDGSWTAAATFAQFTTTGDVLVWQPSNGSAIIEAFRMTTRSSLSWPEWYEIEVEQDNG